MRRRAKYFGLEALGGLLVGIVALLFCNQVAWMHPRSWLWANRIDVYGGQDLGGTLFLLARSLAGDEGMRTQLVGWPVGHSFNNAFLNPLFTDLMAPFVRLLDQPLGYNVALLLALASNGLAAQLAVRLAGADRGAGLLVAALVAASPFAMNEALEGRPVSAWWAPSLAATAFCVAGLTSWKKMWLFVPGLWCLWIALVVYPYAPALLAPWTLLAGLAMVLHTREDLRGRLARAGVGAVLAAGLMKVFLSVSNIHPSTSLLFNPPGGGDGTHLGHVVPTELFYLGVAGAPDAWFSVLRTLGLGNLAIDETSLLRVPAFLVLAVVTACVLGRKTAAAWAPALGSAVILFAISLGNEGAGFYGWFMEHVPWYRACPRPDRYAMPAWILLVMVLGLALSAAWSPRGRRLKGGLGIGLGYLVLLQIWTRQPNPLQRWPPFVGLGGLETESLILDLPFGLPDKTILLLYATLPVTRITPPPQSFGIWRDGLREKDWPLLQALAQVEDEGSASPSQLARIAEGRLPEVAAGLRCVAVHPERAHDQDLTGWMEVLKRAGAKQTATTSGGIVFFKLVDETGICLPDPVVLEEGVLPPFPKPLNAPGTPPAGAPR
jgi:hypothetical protein